MLIMCRGHVLDSLMKQHEHGSITGIHGRLGDLGTIDKKYDVVSHVLHENA